MTKREMIQRWKQNNRDRVNAAQREWRKNNPLSKDQSLKLLLRVRLNIAIKKGFKGGSAVKNLGCSIQEFKAYLESKFQPGMTWDNHTKNGWHIDHIKPLSIFDLTKEDQIKAACHYTNMQPMWAKDNLKKGNRV